MAAGRNAVDRNSDGSYDAVHSGFGKDYHGQDVFGERIGGTGIGGGKFGGFEEGHVGLDKDNTDKYEKLSSEELAQTESMPKSAFEADNGNESEEEAGSGMRDSLRDLNSESSEENINTGSKDTSMLIGENEDEKAKSSFTDKMEPGKELEANSEKAKDEDEKEKSSFTDKMEPGKELEANSKKAKDEDEKEKSSFTDKMEPGKELKEEEEKAKDEDEKEKSSFTDKKKTKESKELEDAVEKANKELEAANKEFADIEKKYKEKMHMVEETRKATSDIMARVAYLSRNPLNSLFNRSELNELKSNISEGAKTYGLNLDPNGNLLDIAGQYVDAVNAKLDSDSDLYNKVFEAARSKQQNAQNAAKEAKSNLDKYNSSFTDKMEESKEEAKPGLNMSKASVGESDYLTKANKDSTKKEGPSRNDYGNHFAGTLKGAADMIADNTTAKALGIQSLEDFAKENGYDPNKFSTMKAYQSYQNKQIMKAIPTLMKKVGGFFVERLKDFFDLSQLPGRVRNTLARYNPATLVAAAILSIQSGAGIQASIDQALTMVDPEDQPDVSDYLEGVLNDEGIVADLSNAFDDALAPEQTSNTAELDESIVNIGRKDNTDYSDFNAGLGTTSSDADVKVFIARNVKADPILRRMISKIGN